MSTHLNRRDFSRAATAVSGAFALAPPQVLGRVMRSPWLHRRGQPGLGARQGDLARAAYCSNIATRGIGHAPESEPPTDLDWDLGWARARPFQAKIMPYKFRWWQLYSSQVANWGVHYLDLAR